MTVRTTAAVLFVASIAMSPCTLPGQETATAKAGPRPTPIAIGIHVLDVYDLNLKNSSYVVDFYIWLRWKGDVDPRRFELMNGELAFKDNPDEKKLGDVNYVSYRVRGTFRAHFDFTHFPLDTQALAIEIEDSSNDATCMTYEVDRDNISPLTQANLSGWELAGDPSYEVREQAYSTNYGNPQRSSGQRAVYSRFVVTIPIRHAGDELIYLKTFVCLFISTAIAFLTFLIDPIDLDPRFGVGIAGIFGVVSSMIVVSGYMPENPYLTLADQLHFVSLGFVFLTIFASCVVLRIFKSGREKLSRMMDACLGSGLAAAYFASIAILSRW